MKNLYLILIIVFLTTNCGVIKSSNNSFEFENGWYLETVANNNSKPISDKFSTKLFYVNPSPIVLASDYSKIGITKQNWGGKEYMLLELVFDGVEKMKWAEATEKMSNTSEKAVFIYKDQVISTVSAFRKMENGYASVSSDNFTEQMLTEILNDIKKEK